MRKIGWVFFWLGVSAPLPYLFVLMRPPDCCSQRASNERNARATLKTLASAQEDFRANDRDGDGRREFWRWDIAGLYTLVPPGETDPVKLIEVSAANADAARRKPWGEPTPKAGYLFRSIPFSDENPEAPDPARFAACAYPADYPRSGRKTYVIREDGVVFERDLGRPGPPGVYPDPETRARDWVPR